MDPAHRFAETPVNRWFGARLLGRGPGHAELELPVRAEFRQEEGVIHGGILATLADAAAVYALHPDLPAETAMTSIEFKVNFLAAAAVDGAPLRAAATVLRRGRTIAVVESEVRQGDTLVAKGTFTYLIRPRRP